MFSLIAAVFLALIYRPLYNALVFLIGALPTHDVGLAVITLTIIVRIILLPLSRRALDSQFAMRKVAPEVEKLKAKYKKNSPEASQAIFALYKERGVHPFASVGLMFIQLFILIPLYYIFARSGLPTIDPATLYSFVHIPAAVNMEFLGFLNMSTPHHIVLSCLVALSQFAFIRLSMGVPNSPPSPIEESLSADMAKSMEFQARYMMPAMIGVIAFFLPAAAPLYYITFNTFMLVQEYAAGRRF